MTQPAPSTFGKYRILDRVASGGMAEIFKARLEGIGGFHRTFAIKRILPHLTSNPEFVDLLVDEAKVAGLLSHANIVQILDLGRIDDHYFIAMEYVSGHNLGEVMKRCLEKGITLPVPHAVFICIEVLKGLEYAHHRQVMRDGRPVPLDIVHRDVSPSNILVSNQGEVKITDFGMAKASVKALETIDGVVKGRFDYLDPAQAQGKPVSQRTDLFSLGVVFYEMLVGDHPFRRDTDMATLEAIRGGQFEPASFVNMDIPAQLDDVIGKALAADPADRFANATAFKEELDRFFHESEFIFTQSTLAAFLKGLFPEQKHRRAGRGAPPPRRPMDRASPMVPPTDFDDEDILPTVVQENPLSRADAQPARPKPPPPRTPGRSPAAASIHEAATMLRRIPDASAANPFAQPAGLADAATLIRANPLLDGGELGEAETQIKRRPSFEGKPLVPDDPAEPGPTSSSALSMAFPEPEGRPTLARADLERPTVASDPPAPSGEVPSWGAPAGHTAPSPPGPDPWGHPPPPAQAPPPAPTAPHPAGVYPQAYPPSAHVPIDEAPIPPHQPVAAAPLPSADPLPARIPLRTHLAYMAGAVFTFILGLLLGAVTTYAVASQLLVAPETVSAPSTARVSFLLPDGAKLEVDGKAQASDSNLELDPGRTHEVRVLMEGQEPTAFPLQLTAGEHRTVVVSPTMTE